MTAQVFSSLWYRVGALRPCIDEAVRVERQPCRGETWHLLVDARTGRSLRLNRPAYSIAGRLTGTHSVQQVWDAACEQLGDAAPTQDECIGILAQLHGRGLLRCERSADFDATYRQYREQNARHAAPARNPLAFRITLGDPSRLLIALQAWGERVFRWPVLVLWTLCVAAGAVAAAANADALVAHAAKWLATPRYLLIALAVYPLVKAVHELAHGLAIRRFGGEVRAWGITLLVAMPVPFVDGAAAVCLPKVHQRVLAAAAGIMAELLIAAAALGAFLALEPGLVRDAAFVAAFIGAVSTLLFNANPLLKFDGYHVLTDALQLPGLAGRSARYWGEALTRLVLRVAPAEPLVAARGERPWLVLYAPVSGIYRIALACAIVVWAGSHSFLLGAALAALIAIQLLLSPLRWLRRACMGAGATRGGHLRALAAGATAAALLAIAITAVPVPFSAVAQGVVWIPDDAQLRAETEGFVAATPVADGAQVEMGDVLIELRNPALATEAVGLHARIAALETELFQALRSDAARALDATEDLAQAKAELARTQERIAALTIRAPSAGRLVLPRQADRAETYVRKGDLLGHVLAPGDAIVRVAVAHHDAPGLESHTREVSTWFAGEAGPAVRGELVRDSTGANMSLPSAAMSTRNGGAILTDPDAKDALSPLEAVVLLDVRVPAAAAAGRTGQRAWVRFDFGAEPLAQQWARRARQALLKHFNPAS